MLLKIGKRYLNPNLIATVETGVRTLHPDHHVRKHSDKFADDAVVLRVLGNPEAVELFDADARAFVAAIDPASAITPTAPASAETETTAPKDEAAAPDEGEPEA